MFTSTNDYAIILELGPSFQGERNSPVEGVCARRTGQLVPLETVATVSRAPARSP